MKKKITLTYRKQAEASEDVEVEFPIYRHIPDGPFHDDETFERHDENGLVTTVQLWTRRGSKEYALSVRFRPDWYKRIDWDANAVDIMLGRGAYACTKEEFEQAARQAAGLLGGLPGV